LIKTSPFTKHMANAVFIMPKASLMVSAINIVEDIFKEIEKDATEGGHAFQDIQGDVYEMMLSEIASSGKNMIMHGIDEPKIDYKDTLSKSYNEDGLFNIVMANPPFTGSIDKGDINEGLKLPTTKTELLFVERIFNML
jgi:type I restriction-modification system DNA methylase subunit